MVRIRLTRMGAKKRPFYRMVAADARAPRDGRFIEQLGYYDPMREPMVVELKLERIDHWLSHGAQPSETAEKLITRARAAAEAAAKGEVLEQAPKVKKARGAKARARAAAEADASAPAEAPAEETPAEATPEAEATPGSETTPEAEES